MRFPQEPRAPAPPISAALALALALPLGSPPPAAGYQLLGGADFVWADTETPVRYWVANRPGGRLTADRVVSETRAAFDVWAAPPEIGISLSYQGKTNQLPFQFFDATNTVGFSTAEHLKALGISPTTLAVTSWLIGPVSGAILESDIIVNPNVEWTHTPEDGGWDFRSMIVHEAGHFLGLGHSGVGRESEDRLLPGSAVMWPFSFGPGQSHGRTLTADDIAGASVLYPGPGANAGSIRGVVVRPDGSRVGHAHLVAYEPSLDQLVGAWADENGEYEIGGLPGGRYVLRANPMHAEHSFFRYFFEPGAVDTDFRVTVVPRLVAVPANRTTEVVIEVRR